MALRHTAHIHLTAAIIQVEVSHHHVFFRYCKIAKNTHHHGTDEYALHYFPDKINLMKTSVLSAYYVLLHESLTSSELLNSLYKIPVVF